jgi:hypothetical protein
LVSASRRTNVCHAVKGELLKKRSQSSIIGTVIPICLFVLIACSAAMAQRGGKAEPNRIEFKTGTTSTTISGSVSGREQAEYVLAAKKGQKLTIRITSVPARSSGFDLHGSDDVDLGLELDANLDYSHTLPRTGDYLITVVKLTDVVRTSKYKLTVTVR